MPGRSLLRLRGRGAAFESVDPAPACPRCGSLDVRVQGGDEVILEWVEYRGIDVERPDELVPEHTHPGEVG